MSERHAAGSSSAALAAQQAALEQAREAQRARAGSLTPQQMQQMQRIQALLAQQQQQAQLGARMQMAAGMGGDVGAIFGEHQRQQMLLAGGGFEDGFAVDPEDSPDGRGLPSRGGFRFPRLPYGPARQTHHP
jgi:hypothetical protein